MLRGKEALEAALAQHRRPTNKYHVSPAAERTVDGIRFDSKAEARYYQHLVQLRTAGVVSFFLRQVPIHLPGGVRLVIDFLVFFPDGSFRFDEVKGHKTASYKAKKRIAESLYPVTINELR